MILPCMVKQRLVGYTSLRSKQGSLDPSKNLMHSCVTKNIYHANGGETLVVTHLRNVILVLHTSLLGVC